jgi:hypothetical protein
MYYSSLSFVVVSCCVVSYLLDALGLGHGGEVGAGAECRPSGQAHLPHGARGCPGAVRVGHHQRHRAHPHRSAHPPRPTGAVRALCAGHAATRSAAFYSGERTGGWTDLPCEGGQRSVEGLRTDGFQNTVQCCQLPSAVHLLVFLLKILFSRFVYSFMHYCRRF